MTDPHDHSTLMRRLFLLACGATWVFEFVLTHIPADHLPRLETADWQLHGVAFLAVSGTFIAAMVAYNIPRWRRILLAASILPLYAAIDELTQPLVHRTASLDDWLADLVGAMIALVAIESALAIRSAFLTKKL